jgi:hypothetical protein
MMISGGYDIFGVWISAEGSPRGAAKPIVNA